jgi:hypothetical protein
MSNHDGQNHGAGGKRPGARHDPNIPREDRESRAKPGSRGDDGAGESGKEKNRTKRK